MKAQLVLFVFLFWLPFWGSCQPPEDLRVEWPRAGEALQGVASIRGSTAVDGFESAELAFAYDRESPDTWFFIAGSRQPVSAGELASWDTTLITDGEYRLRVRVLDEEGNSVEAHVRGLRVRNYTPVETERVEPTQAVATATGAAPPSPEKPSAAPSSEAEAGSGVFNLVRRLGFVVLGFVVIGLAALLLSLFQHRANG